MSDLRRRIDALEGRSLPEMARLATRKLVYRRVALDRLGMRTGDTSVPDRPTSLTIELWGPDRYGDVLGHSPYLTANDLDVFREQQSTCIVVFDEGRIVANSWMTKGDVYVHELHRTVEVGATQHFSCRSYVDPDYRGQALLGHMIATYCASVPPDDEVWGLVYRWNRASLLTLERLGWLTTGECSTRFVFGRKIAGERHFAPQRPTSLEEHS